MKLAAKVRGLSEPAFRARFGTEEQCLAVLFTMRWGRGFTCERCGCRKYSRMKSRKQVQCNACKHQTGFTAGIIFHSTKLPLGGFRLQVQRRLRSSKPDADVFAKAFEESLDRGEIAEALSWREVERENDLLEVGLARGVEIEMPGQLSSESAIGVLDAAFLPAGVGVAEPGGHAADAGEQAVAGEFAAPPRPAGLGPVMTGAACLLARLVEGDRTLQLGGQPLEDRHEGGRGLGSTLAGELAPGSWAASVGRDVRS